MKEFEDKNYWALIIGGSSGLGLATAKKLAKHGMNICIVHRNSRAQQKNIDIAFEEIAKEANMNEDMIKYALEQKNLNSASFL